MRNTGGVHSPCTVPAPSRMVPERATFLASLAVEVCDHVLENNSSQNETLTLAEAIATSGAFSIAGGGDTLAAVDKYGIAKDVSYISTGGGAFLEFCEGKVLPAVAALEARGG